MQKFNIINEIEIDDNFIENIVPNYFKYLDNDLKIEAKEFFNDYEIRKYEIDFNNNDINKYKFSKSFKKNQYYTFFSCYECSFVDKYGNPGWRIFVNRRAFINHANAHFDFIKKGCIFMVKFPEEYEYLKLKNNNKITFAVKKETIGIYKKEKEKNNENSKNKYGNNKKCNINNNTYKIIGWNAVSIASSHNNL